VISPEHLRNIIRLSLDPFGWWSQEAEELLLMTAAHESQLGKYNEQIVGPALGLYQIEPETLRDNYLSWLCFRKPILEKITAVSGVPPLVSVLSLQYNPIYATIHARIKYLRAPGKIPSDVWLMAEYAKDNFNTSRGKATPDDYYMAYRNLVVG
jgi:hypothetical protein